MIYLVTFLVFALIIAGMAVGVMAGRAPISGSCGGVGRLGIDQKCEICGDDPQRCEAETRDASPAVRGKTRGQAQGVGTFDPRA